MQEAEVMTQNEAVAAAELYRRERDAAAVEENEACALMLEWIGRGAGKKACVYEALARTVRARKSSVVARFMQRPGYQNGMAGIEEMEAEG